MKVTEAQMPCAKSPMSFYERSAWILTGALLIIYVPYFGATLLFAAEIPAEMPVFTLGFIIAAIGLMVLVIGGHIAAAAYEVVTRGSIDTNFDERDQQIELKATKWSCIAPSLGMWGVLGALFFDVPTYWLAQAILFVIVIESVLLFSLKALAYRKQR